MKSIKQSSQSIQYSIKFNAVNEAQRMTEPGAARRVERALDTQAALRAPLPHRGTQRAG